MPLEHSTSAPSVLPTGGDPLVAHWLCTSSSAAASQSERSSGSGAFASSHISIAIGPQCLAHHSRGQAAGLVGRKQNIVCSDSSSMAGHLMTTSSRRGKHAWLWPPEGNALSDTLLRVVHLPSAKGETAEQLEAKRPCKEDFRVHSVVLAVQSAYFRQRLMAKATGVGGGGSSEGAPQGSAPPGLLPACGEDGNSCSGAAEDSDPGCSTMGMASGDELDGAPNNSAKQARARQQQQQLVQQHQQQQQPAERGYMYTLEERLAPSDLPAARAVLRHMYTEELVFDSPSQLVSVLKIADKWKAADTIDACRAAFAHLEPEDLDLDVIKQVYSLEGIIHDVQNFAELVAAVQSRLVQMFQDIADVVQNPSTRNLFLQLPFAAVMALLRSPQLIVDSEDSVLVAANLWVTAGKGRATTLEQRKYLAGVVNLAGLSPAYLCGVLPNIRWFTSSGGQPFVSWPQTLPAPYYQELQQRLVSGKARQVLAGSSASGGAPPTGLLTREPSLSLTSGAATASLSSDGAASAPPLPAPPSAPPAPPPPPPPSRSFFGGSKQSKALPAPPQQPASSVATAAAGSGRQATSASAGGQSSQEESQAAATRGGAAAAAGGAQPGRVLRDQNLEIECDIEFARLKQYIEDGHFGLMSGTHGFRGIHVHSQCSYFKGFMWGIKLVFGFSNGHNADGSPPPFTVTPSPFASLPPGEDSMRPLMAPISVSFRCTIEAVAGDKAGTYASATYQGASFLRPGEDHVSSIGIANFFKRVPQQHLPDSWLPYLTDGKLRLRLRVVGSSVE